MNKEFLEEIKEAVFTIAAITQTQPEDVVDRLEGLCWDEEEKGEICRYTNNSE